jgi:succinate dehydrogenase / fumarate reductase membrane anchor subunit
MVTNVTSLTQNGLRDWLIQRVTAYILGFYVIFLLLYLLCHPQMNYSVWQHLYANPWMRIFSFLALLSMVFHSWVGIWTVLTDYIKPNFIRLLLEVLLVLALFAYLAWGIEILWSF